MLPEYTTEERVVNTGWLGDVAIGQHCTWLWTGASPDELALDQPLSPVVALKPVPEGPHGLTFTWHGVTLLSEFKQRLTVLLYEVPWELKSQSPHFRLALCPMADLLLPYLWISPQVSVWLLASTGLYPWATGQAWVTSLSSGPSALGMITTSGAAYVSARLQVSTEILRRPIRELFLHERSLRLDKNGP